MKSANQLLVLFCALTIISCNTSVKESVSADKADAIYFGGDIITMEGDSATYIMFPVLCIFKCSRDARSTFPVVGGERIEKGGIDIITFFIP